DPLACTIDTAAHILTSYASYPRLAECLAYLGAGENEGPEAIAKGEDAAAEAVTAMKAALAIGAAVIATIHLRESICENNAANQYAQTVSSDACRPVLDNPGLCTCFDAPGCPTIARCGGSTTHISGIVSCGSIRNGIGTDDPGNPVSCVSWTNQTDHATCLGE